MSESIGVEGDGKTKKIILGCLVFVGLALFFNVVIQGQEAEKLEESLKALKTMHEKGLLTDEVYNKKQEELLKQIAEGAKAKPAEKKEEEKTKKRMILIKFDKGEKPGGAKCTLSKKNPLEGKKYTVKVTVEEGSSPGFVLISKESGLLQGKRGNWKDYDTLNIKYISEFNIPISGSLLIGDEGSATEWNGNYASPQAVLLPGDHTLSIDVTTLETWRTERALDLEKMRIIMCYFKQKMDQKGAIYIQDVYVEEE